MKKRLWRGSYPTVFLLVLLMIGAAPLTGGAADFKIGVLTPGLSMDPVQVGLREGLEKLGHSQGKGVSFVVEDTQSGLQELPERAKKLVDQKVDAIFTITTTHTQAAKAATSTIPIVYAWVFNPVASGLIAGYSSSKNNITGVLSYSDALIGKRLELLHEFAPRVKRVLTFYHPQEVVAVASLKLLQETAKKLNLQIVAKEVTGKEEIPGVIERLSKKDIDAIYQMPSTVVVGAVDLLIKKALAEKIPFGSLATEIAEQGALFAYGGDFRLVGAQAARLMAKVIKGEKPADIPSEAPDKYILVVNAKTAQTIGVKLTDKILDKVDRIVK